jgi:hypothetical protein
VSLRWFVLPIVHILVCRVFSWWANVVSFCP